MLDAQPSANAPARLPAIHHLPASPPVADTTGVRSKPAALLAAATALLPSLEAGRAIDATTLREAMSAAFGAGDAQGAWVWKDAYEAAEAAMVLFIQRYGPPHAPRGGRRARIRRRHARHAGDPGGAGAVPNKAVGGTARPATVLHPLAARLRRAASRRHPARRHRAGALSRHRHARRHGRMRPSASAPITRDRGIPCT